MPVWNGFASCSLPVEYIFPRSFYVFLAIFTSGKIDSDVVCLQFAVIMARFGNVNADEITYIFFFYIQNEMLNMLLPSPSVTVFL